MVVGLSLAGWSFVLAVAGVVIAVATFLGNRQAISDERRDRKKAIEDAWTFEWQRQRPVVYPVLSRITTQQALPVKNAGQGPALNVVADLWYLEENGETFTVQVGIGPVAVGDIEAGDFVGGGTSPPPWPKMSGVLHYSDLAGGEYAHPFRFWQGPRGELRLTVEEQQHRTPAEIAAG